MLELDYNDLTIADEIQAILQFIGAQSGESKLLIGVSGGIDSDVIARLCAQAIGPERITCFIVLQEQFEDKYINNAVALTKDIHCSLIRIPFAPIPKQLISIMAEADPSVGFRPEGLLDVARSKCALRTFVFSAYAERGYLVAGTSNKTEIELGYYLPFGDGLSHFSPIAHLYKTQVQQLARALGTHENVQNQQPAAGFWHGDSDLEGIAYWLYNGAPIQVELELNQAQQEAVNNIHAELSFRRIDTALIMLSRGEPDEAISEITNLSVNTVSCIRTLRNKSATTKNRRLSLRLS